MKNSLLAYILILLLTGCNDNKQIILRTSTIYDSITIINDFPFLSQYSANSAQSIDGKHILAGYNGHVHAIDFFDLSNGISLYSLPLEREGDNGITANISDLSLTLSFIALIENKRTFAIIDHQGKVIKKIDGSDIIDPVNNSNIYMIAPFRLSLSNYRSYLNYHPKNKSFTFTTYPLSTISNPEFKNFYIGAELDITNEKFDFIKVTYNNIFEEVVPEDYGDLIYPNITDTGDHLIINSPFNSIIYTFDKKSTRLNKYNPQSFFTENISTPLHSKNSKTEENKEDIINRIKYEFYAMQFREVYYSERLQHYYRIHYGEKKSEKNSNRDRILMIMNKRMEPVSEIKLPEHFTDQYFTCEDIIYFYIRNETDDMHLAAIKIEDNM